MLLPNGLHPRARFRAAPNRPFGAFSEQISVAYTFRYCQFGD